MPTLPALWILCCSKTRLDTLLKETVLPGLNRDYLLCLKSCWEILHRLYLWAEKLFFHLPSYTSGQGSASTLVLTVHGDWLDTTMYQWCYHKRIWLRGGWCVHVKRGHWLDDRYKECIFYRPLSKGHSARGFDEWLHNLYVYGLLV